MTFELVCKDYGHECDFIAAGEDGEYVMREFGKHTDDEHGLWYSEESLKQIFQNKYNKKQYYSGLSIILPTNPFPFSILL